MKRSTLALAALAALSFQTTAQAIVLYDADNEGFALGSTPPTTGPLDAPTFIDSNLGLTVQDGSTVAAPNLGPDQFLRLTESPGEAPDFQYELGSSLTSGTWEVSMDLLFENLEDYHVYFRETPSAAINVADIRFLSTGDIIIDTLGGTSTASYVAGTPYELVAHLDLDLEVMDLFLNGTQIVTSQAIDDIFGSAIIGFEFTSFDPLPGGFDGIMQVDNFLIQSTSVPEPSALALVGIALAGLGIGRRRS